QAGVRVVPVYAAQEFRQLGETSFECGPDVAGFASVFAATSSLNISRVVHLWTLDNCTTPVAAKSLAEAQYLGSESLIALARAAAAEQRKIEIAAVTAGVAAINPDFPVVEHGVVHSPMIGVARTIGNEFPEFKPLLIDLDPDDRSVDALAAELLATVTETELAIR